MPTDLLTVKLAPKKREELVIHKAKINEVLQWLENAFLHKQNAPPVLFLTGPTGSGKSTCVEVLCKELRIELIDYTPEYLHNEKLECETGDSTQLLRFLIKRHASFQNSSRKRILLVSELPDQAYRNSDTFREEFTEIRENLHHPVIFCLSNGVGNWDLNPDRIFNQELLYSNGIVKITFNPVADSFILKALKRAASLMGIMLSDSKCQTLSSEAHGDLRLAMNMLQMNQNLSKRQNIVSASKSNREEPFHMIGRILYAKRGTSEAGKKKKRKSDKSQKTLTSSSEEQEPLEYDASDIITMSSMSADKLVNFIFESELIFCSDVSKYRHVVDDFSLVDVFSSDWSTRKAIPEEYEAQIVTRSVMWHNFQGPRPRTLYQMRRPVLTELNRELAVLRQEIRNLPMIGDKYFTSLTAPFVTKIDNYWDVNCIESFVSRPCSISWKLGKDRIGEQMERLNCSKRPKKSMKIEERMEEEMEEEKWTIEDSSDDSFDAF